MHIQYYRVSHLQQTGLTENRSWQKTTTNFNWNLKINNLNKFRRRNVLRLRLIYEANAIIVAESLRRKRAASHFAMRSTAAAHTTTAFLNWLIERSWNKLHSDLICTCTSLAIYDLSSLRITNAQIHSIELQRLIEKNRAQTIWYTFAMTSLLRSLFFSLNFI